MMGAFSVLGIPAFVVYGVGALIGLALCAIFLKAYRQPFWGLCVFIFFSAITITPALPVIKDRLVFADFVMVFVILGMAVRGTLFRPAPPDLKLIDQMGALFIALCTLSSLVALLGNGEPSRVILFMLIYVYGYFSFRAVIRVVDTRERFYILCFVWAAAATMVVIIGALAASGIYKPAWTFDPTINRISSTFKKSGQVSSYLGPALFILAAIGVARVVPTWMRLSALVLLALGSYVLLWTGSRVSFAILVFSLLCIVAAVQFTKGKMLRKTPMLMGFAAGATVFVLFAVSVATDTSEKYGLLSTSPVERAIRIFAETSRDENAGFSDWGGTRAHEISIAFENFPNHPVFGVGSGMFSQTYRVNEIHNTYISILSENGFLAFLAFISWWGIIGIMVIKAATGLRVPEERFMAQMILGAISALAIYQMTTNGMRQRPFWFTPAIAASAIVILRREQYARQHQAVTYGFKTRRRTDTPGPMAPPVTPSGATPEGA